LSWQSSRPPASNGMEFTNLGDLVPVVIIAGALLAGLLWIIRGQSAMSREFRPNGGASMKDAVNRIEKDLRDVRYRMDKHIDNHDK
jgi:hypothetical protein